ncbi:hypothetical protein BN997_03862 [Oceanobacillus oncorhynchi]|uniref:Uncharacterized protein n=1 Tax=Oceanobacillus oncorhynchi TaxID=545501 RepID=A0A0A1MWH5_9BACI|nr:hypothetical protein BN997_03862 [Oceanobacillus oncorhynchi]
MTGRQAVKESPFPAQAETCMNTQVKLNYLVPILANQQTTIHNNHRHVTRARREGKDENSVKVWQQSKIRCN